MKPVTLPVIVAALALLLATQASAEPVLPETHNSTTSTTLEEAWIEGQGEQATPDPVHLDFEVVNNCDVTFRATNSVVLGSLSLDVDYSGADGAFLGSGGNTQCAGLIADSLISANNISGSELLRLAIVKLNGFSAPANVFRCVFATDGSVPTPADFDVTVTEASTPLLQEVFASANVSSVQCTAATPVCGDANGDNVVTASDGLAALRVGVGIGTCSLLRCDFNGDAMVSASDALLILNTSVGRPTTPNCPTSGASPAAPNGLGATAASSSQINLVWNDNSSNETGFKIERKTGAGGTYAQIATVGAGVESYQNTGLASSTQFFYRVRASNESGNSGYSNEANATTSGGSVPTAPSSLAATAASSSQINLVWNDNSSNETGFKIERKTGIGGTYAQIDTVGAGVESYQNTGLASSTQFYYRVRAYNGAGNSGYSNEANATTSGSVPAAPSGLSATAASSSQINLVWNDNSSNETGFKIERKTGVGGTYAQIDTVGAGVGSYQNTGLTSSTQFFYRVRAYNGAGNSGYSNEANATTGGTGPAAPSSLIAIAETYTHIRLYWNDNSSNETEFKIESKLGAGGTYVQIGTVPAGSTAVLVTGNSPNTTYFFRIRAHNAAGDSAYSNADDATTATRLTNEVRFNGEVGWEIANGQVRFDVERIENITNNYTSGTLRLSLWAVETPYLGRSGISGYRVGSYQLGELPPNTFYNPFSVFAPYVPPPGGNYYTVVTLDEFNGEFFIIDYLGYPGLEDF